MSEIPTAVASTSSPPAPDVNLRDLVRSSPRWENGNKAVLFSTDAPENLWELFVATLPEPIRQTYNCRACSRFAAQYGGLVVIDSDGVQRAAFWMPTAWVPEEFRPAFDRLAGIVARSKVTGLFLGATPIWGVPENYDAKRARTWEHLSFEATYMLHYVGAERGANAKMGEAHTNHEVLARSIGELKSVEPVRAAIEILESGRLSRPEKALPQAKWLEALQTKLETVTGRPRHNLLWLAAATAPAGWCHVRSGMLGTLLDDIVEKRNFAFLKAAWDEKMDPLAYQRAQAPVSEGNVRAAEKLVAEMGIAESLRRRFLRKDEVAVKLWGPSTEKGVAAAGVFGHLLKKSEASDHDIGSSTITWRKFTETVLPRAVKLEFWVPPSYGFYGAFVTAADPDAPPILQWDYPDARNPVSQYQYAQSPRQHGSWPVMWGLKAREYVNVWAITPPPALWNAERRPANQPDMVFLLLEGMSDKHVAAGNPGGGFFTESLKSELHPIRSTLEHYVKNAVIEGANEVAGVAFHDGAMPITVRVTTGRTRANYNIDRWD